MEGFLERLCRVGVSCVLALFVGVASSAAQQLSLSGTVDDTYGAVPSVPVTLRAQDGSTRNTTTDAEGRYRFTALKAGTYEVTVAKEGFNPAAQTIVFSTQSQTVNLTLTIAGFVATVDVFDVAGKGTSSGMYVPSRDIPAQVSVVSAATIREQGITDLPGMMSLNPFPSTRGASQEGRRGASPAGIPQALRGGVRWGAFAAKHPREALTQLSGLGVKELELTSVIGQPYYIARLSGTDTRMIPLDGEPQLEIDRRRIMDAVTKAALPAGGLSELRIVDRPELYYVSRWNYRPLPVILARVNDVEGTRYYIDPRTAGVVTTYGARNWSSRWLYHGMHSLDFPWLYDHRPLWDIVMIAFMVGGTALCVTSLILAWRVMGRTLARSVDAYDTAKEALASEDLALETD